MLYIQKSKGKTHYLYFLVVTWSTLQGKRKKKSDRRQKSYQFLGFLLKTKNVHFSYDYLYIFTIYIM